MPPTPTPAPQYYVVAEVLAGKIADQFGSNLGGLLSPTRTEIGVAGWAELLQPQPVSICRYTRAANQQSPTATVVRPLYYAVVEAIGLKIANRFGITLEELLSANGCQLMLC